MSNKIDKIQLLLTWVATVNIFESIKRFYGALIDLIGFIVDKTSDQGADIAIRALPIVSPLPNAISMYYVSQTVLKFTDPQAKAFAIAMELALFGLFEVVLKMFDGWQRDPKRYKAPLSLAAGIAIFVMVLIIVVVAIIETDRPILATLPLFSAAGAAALSLRRWHTHNEQAEHVQAKVWQTRFGELQTELEAERVRHQSELAELIADHVEAIRQMGVGFATERTAMRANLCELEEAINELRIDNAKLSERLVVRVASIGVSEPSQTVKSEPSSSEKRRFDFLRILAETSKKSEINFAEVGRRFGTSDTTMRKDLQWLIDNEYWLNGSDWKLTQKGLTVVPEPSFN